MFDRGCRAAFALVLSLCPGLLGPAARSAEPAHPVVVAVGQYVKGVAGPLPVHLARPEGPAKALPALDPETFHRLLREDFAERGIRLDPKSPTVVRVDYSDLKPDETGAGYSRLDIKVGVGRLGSTSFHVEQPSLATLTRVEDSVEQLAVAELARKLTVLLAARKAATAHVKPFNGPSNAGVGYARSLTLALKREGVGPDETAALQVETRFYLDDVEGARKTRLVLEARLIDSRTGKELAACRAEALLHRVADEGPGVADYWIARGANDTGERPGPEAPRHASIVRAPKGQPFGLELLVADRPLPLEAGKLEPLVRLAEKDEYVIRIHNEAEFDAAVDLRIDGLTLFAFEKTPSPPRSIIVPARKSVVVRGWFVSLDTAQRFTVARYGDPSLSGIASTGQVGCITAVFRAAWPTAGKPPQDEEVRDIPLSTRPGSIEKTRVVPVERIIGRERASVTIRYAAKEAGR